MQRLLLLLLISTLVLPLITGAVAVLIGFGDPWGMGAQDPFGVFVTAALPLLPPGLYQVLAWPLSYGVALLLSPLALLRHRGYYLIVMLVYLGALCAGWILAWTHAPERLNMLFDHRTYVSGVLNSGLRKFGAIQLTDAALLTVTLLWWYWRGKATIAGGAPSGPAL